MQSRDTTEVTEQHAEEQDALEVGAEIAFYNATSLIPMTPDFDCLGYWQISLALLFVSIMCLIYIL